MIYNRKTQGEAGGERTVHTCPPSAAPQALAGGSERPAEARGEAPSEANSAINKLWWCLLEKVRTHFEQNPD